MACDGDYIYMKLTQTGKQIPSYDPLCSERGWRIETEFRTCNRSPTPLCNKSSQTYTAETTHQPAAPEIDPNMSQSSHSKNHVSCSSHNQLHEETGVTNEEGGIRAIPDMLQNHDREAAE